MFHDPIADNKFAELQKRFGFDICVETGTDVGHGALHASKYCDTVITCDINPDTRDKAIANWVHAGYHVYENNDIVSARLNTHLIASHLKSSPILLDQLPKDLNEPICFYLDAHWGAYWPLLDEMKEIANWDGRESCVIIIHDFKVPGKPWAFDNHGGQDLDIDYVKPSLDRINPKFNIFYNEEASGNQHGILYATP